ncbi:hypothetical protein CEXT_484701 [Caerostris extrusa]|uniref:Uncharacterized protein n=1 Tax=Caerostris extrusa TaxID=172846 RepID=A0AAV4M7I2_CAEEX|nr:hypothetical protein CEXT_484701 [Caerostris extrusa]
MKKKPDSHGTEETEETETIDGTPTVTKTVTTVIRKIVTSDEGDDESYTTMTTTSDEQKESQVVSKDSSQNSNNRSIKIASGEKTRLTCNRRHGNNRWKPLVTKTVTTVIRKIVTSDEGEDESYTTMTTTSDEQKDTQVVSKTDSSETVTTEILKSPSKKSPTHM